MLSIPCTLHCTSTTISRRSVPFPLLSYQNHSRKAAKLRQESRKDGAICEDSRRGLDNTSWTHKQSEVFKREVCFLLSISLDDRVLVQKTRLARTRALRIYIKSRGFEMCHHWGGGQSCIARCRIHAYGDVVLVG